MKFSLTLILISFILSSCEKAIDFNLQQSPTRLVVDASIENGLDPYVVISKSLNYFSHIDSAILDSSFVHNAVVKISNGRKTQILSEVQLGYQNSNLHTYFYAPSSMDTSTYFVGEFNTTYDLEITVNGQTYTSQTHITSIAKKIDSLWTLPAPNKRDSDFALIMARITDPLGYGDYTRFYTSIKNYPFYPAYNSVYDDQITDGTTYNFQVPAGTDRNDIIKQGTLNDDLFFKGDTIIVKFCNIDKATYDFWRTMEYNYQGIGNPFSSPTTVIGNISNNGLGAFCGYAAQYVQIVIPK